MKNSIFTKIIKGEIPCYKIYEDDRTIAFLDIHPCQPGHTLVVPKVQVDEFQELDEENYAALFYSVREVSNRLKSVLKPKRIGLCVVGFDVPHAHIHLIPINNGFEDLIPPNPSIEPDHRALKIIHDKLTKT